VMVCYGEGRGKYQEDDHVSKAFSVRTQHSAIRLSSPHPTPHHTTLTKCHQLQSKAPQYNTIQYNTILHDTMQPTPPPQYSRLHNQYIRTRTVTHQILEGTAQTPDTLCWSSNRDRAYAERTGPRVRTVIWIQVPGPGCCMLCTSSWLGQWMGGVEGILVRRFLNRSH
jgi:hypothetical protein